MDSNQKNIEFPPYAFFSQVYDRRTDIIRKQKQVNRLERFFGIDKSNGFIADIACGTGTILSYLAQNGHDVIGIDNSAEMLHIAVQKVKAINLKISFLRASMTNIPLSEKSCKAILCTSFSLSYLKSLSELQIVFRSIKRLLRKRGVFLFDMISPKYVSEHFSSEKIQYKWRDWKLSTIIKEENIDEGVFHIQYKFSNQINNSHRIVENHYIRAYSQETISQVLKEAGFTSYEIANRNPLRNISDIGVYDIIAYN